MNPELTITMVILWAIVLVALWTLCVTPALEERKPRNRRTHRLARWLSCSTTLWRGPRKWVEDSSGIVCPQRRAFRHRGPRQS